MKNKQKSLQISQMLTYEQMIFKDVKNNPYKIQMKDKFFEVIFDYLHHSCTKQNLNEPVTTASYYRIFALLLLIQTIRRPPPSPTTMYMPILHF